MSIQDIRIHRGPFSGAAEILGLINNSSVREPLRRFSPQHHAVFVDKLGRVVLIVSSKSTASFAELALIRDQECPGAAYFSAHSGYFASEAAIQEKIANCVEALAMAPPSSHMEERIIDGKRVLVIGTNVQRKDPNSK